MTKLTGCPVPREVSDSEKILKWLGYRVDPDWNHYVREVTSNGMVFRVGLPVDATNGAALSPDNLDAIRFLPTDDGAALPELDYLVLENVRGLDEAKQRAVEARLDRIWQSRGAVGWQTPLQYLPGDYAEAARFLWEPTP